MLAVIDLFRNQDTVDELGMSAVWDAFADLISAGTAPCRRERGTSSSYRGSSVVRTASFAAGASVAVAPKIATFPAARR